MTILLALSLAYAADPATEASTTGALTVDMYIDTSRSTNGRPEADVALVEGLRSALRPDDRLRVTGFDGTLRPILPETPPNQSDVPAAFKDVAYTGLATFFAPIWLDVSERAASGGDRTRVVVVATDGTSDPLNRRAKDRPQVDDPTWKDPAPTALGDARIIWVVRDVKSKKQEAPILAFTEGAIPARWTEPSQLESTLVFWNPPPMWTSPTADLSAWVTSLRPTMPPLVAEEPPVDWGAIGTYAAASVGGLVALGALSVGLVVARRKAVEKGEYIARGVATWKADRSLRASTTGRAALWIEPLGGGAEPVKRDVRAGDTLDVGPAVSWPGIPLALPGGGFSIQIGSKPDRATVQPRGTRAGVALLRQGYVVALSNGAPVEVGDGDIVIDARSEAPLVRIRLGASAALEQSA